MRLTYVRLRRYDRPSRCETRCSIACRPRAAALLASGAHLTQLVLDDLPALHHEGDGLEDADVGERVSPHRDQIGVPPRLQRADVLRAAEEVRRHRGGAADGLCRGPPEAVVDG